MMVSSDVDTGPAERYEVTTERFQVGDTWITMLADATNEHAWIQSDHVRTVSE